MIREEEGRGEGGSNSFERRHAAITHLVCDGADARRGKGFGRSLQQWHHGLINIVVFYHRRTGLGGNGRFDAGPAYRPRTRSGAQNYPPRI